MGRGPATALIEIKAPDLSHIRRENLQIDVDLFTRGRLCHQMVSGFVPGDRDDQLEVVQVNVEVFLDSVGKGFQIVPLGMLRSWL